MQNSIVFKRHNDSDAIVLQKSSSFLEIKYKSGSIYTYNTPIKIDGKTGGIRLNSLQTGSTSNIIMYDSASGQIFYTASQAIAKIVFPFSGSAVITGSLILTGSGVDITGALYTSDMTYQNTPNVVSWNSTTKRFHYMAGADLTVFPYTGSAVMSGSATNGPLNIIGRLLITGSQRITGSLEVTGSLGVTGSMTIGTFDNSGNESLTITTFPGGNAAVNSALRIDGSGPDLTLRTVTADSSRGNIIKFFRDFSSSVPGEGTPVADLQFWRAYATNRSFVQSGYIRSINVSGSSITSGPGKLTFGTTASGSITPQQRLVIQENGNVGIGALTASAALHVSGANIILDIPSKASGRILQSDANGGATWVAANSTAIFPYTGSAIITGSLGVTGSISGRGDITMISGTYTFRQSNNNTSSFTPNLFLHNTNGILNTHTLITFQNGVDTNGDAVGLAQIGSRRFAGTNGDTSSTFRGDLIFRVRNFGTFNDAFYIRYDGNVGLGKTGSAINARLDISGSTIITGSLNVTAGITASLLGTASRATLAETIQGGTQNYIPLWNAPTSLSRSIIYQSAAPRIGIGTTSPDYLTHIKNTTGQEVLKVEGTGSTNPIFLVEGSQGELFSVTDNISGSLFSVNDNSGLPIMDVISDGTVLMGSYAAPSLNTTVKVYTITTQQILYQIPTGLYDAAFVEYYYTSGSNYASGYLVSSWSGSDVSNNDAIITGNSTALAIEFNIRESNAELSVKSGNNELGYLVEAIIRSI